MIWTAQYVKQQNDNQSHVRSQPDEGRHHSWFIHPDIETCETLYRDGAIFKGTKTSNGISKEWSVL